MARKTRISIATVDLRAKTGGGQCQLFTCADWEDHLRPAPAASDRPLSAAALSQRRAAGFHSDPGPRASRRHAAPTAQRLFSSPLAAMSIATGTRSTEPRIHWGTNCFAHPPGSTASERAGQPSRRAPESRMATRAIARRLASRLEREGLIDKTDRQDLYPGLKEREVEGAQGWRWGGP